MGVVGLHRPALRQRLQLQSMKDGGFPLGINTPLPALLPRRHSTFALFPGG